MPINLFYSYAEEDTSLQKELEKHLKLLNRQGVISGWNFRMITAGKEFEGEIDKHITTAKIILLLVSADFLNSDYCYDIEMKKALEMHKSKIACVIPIILRPVDWQDSPFGELEALPTKGKPITKWRSQDDAFVNIVTGIKKVIREFDQSNNTSIKPSTLKESKIRENSLSANVFCLNCGVKIGRQTDCVGFFDHYYQSFEGDVYCTNCGVKAGAKSQCPSSFGHSFNSFTTDNVFCLNCGVKIGKQTDCIGFFDHNYESFTGDVYCASCGVKAGEKSVCTSILGHTFKSFTK